MNNFIFSKTRIAPTPSGYLHLGNAASFFLTAALAKKANATLLLRIDDLDRERAQPKYVEDIFNTLHFLGIQWREGPQNYTEYEQAYSQLHRLGLYQNALLQLKESGAVFACNCSRAQWQRQHTCHCREQNLSLDAPNLSWRLITDARLPLVVRTGNRSSREAALPLSMHSFVVRKRDGFPAYQLTSLLDDEHFGIDAIVRGEDLWQSTLAQQYLAKVLRKPFFEEVLFYHHPLLMEKDGLHKLSKSAGALSLRHLRSEGRRGEEVIERIEAELQTWQIQL